jgi:Na+/melibiose symporter-like transporter
VGAVLLAVTFALLWLPPAGLSATGITIYLTVAAFMFYLAFTILVIPHSALGLEMVTGYEARTRLSIFRLVPAFLASLIVPTLYEFARSNVFGGNVMVGMRYIGVGIVVVILFTALSAGFFCRERHVAAGALFGNYLLQWSGVRGGTDAAASIVQLAPDVISNIRFAYLLPPAVCYPGAAGFMIACPLMRSRMRSIRAELEARAG